MPVVTRSPRNGSRIFMAKTRRGSHARVLGVSNRSPFHGGKTLKAPAPPGESLPELAENPRPLPPTIPQSEIQEDDPLSETDGYPNENPDELDVYPFADFDFASLGRFNEQQYIEDTLFNHYDNIVNAKIYGLPVDDNPSFEIEIVKPAPITDELIDDVLFETGVEAQSVFSRVNIIMYLKGLGYRKLKHAKANGIDSNGFFVKMRHGLHDSPADIDRAIRRDMYFADLVEVSGHRAI